MDLVAQLKAGKAVFTIIKLISLLAVLFIFIIGYNRAYSAEPNLCKLELEGSVINLMVDNIKSGEGNIRAQLYSDRPEEFLAKGKKLLRVEVPAKEGETQLCLILPAPGDYALVVMHDVNSNGKADIFSEGFGFSNNPGLGLSKPSHHKVLFRAHRGVSDKRINLKYLLGSPDDKEKRKAARRR